MKESANDMKCDVVNLTLFVNLVLHKSFIISHGVLSITIWYYYLFARSQRYTVSPSVVFTVTTVTDLEVCELELLPLAFSVIYVYGGSCSCSFMGGDWHHPTTGRAYCSWGISTIFTYPNVLGLSILNVNDPSRMDVENQTCFICRADYPSGSILRSDPLCVDVAGTLIFDLSMILSNSTKMVVVGSKKVHVLTRPHVHAYPLRSKG